MLGRDPSTISRELRRNRNAAGHDPHWANLLYRKWRKQNRALGVAPNARMDN